MIREENLIPLSGDFLSGQRLTLIDGVFVPVGIGADKVPGTTVVKDIGKGVYYKCTSVSNTTWSGNKAIQAEDGTWSFEDAVTTGLSFTEITPEVGKVYSFDALVEVKLWDGNILPEGYIWGYEKGTLLSENTMQATNNGSISTDSNGFYTFGNGKYFNFNSSIATGASPRTFVFQAVLTDGQRIQFVDGGNQNGSQLFGLGWGKDSNQLFYHFWSNDDSNWLELSAGSYVIAFVYDGSVLKAYKDGELLGTHTTTLDTGTDANYRIGQYVKDDWNSQGEWKSNFCVVYDRALTEEEVIEIVDYVQSFVWIVSDSISKTFIPDETFTYSLDIKDSKGTPASYELISGELPNGVIFDASTGTFSGTPTTEGSYNVVIRCYTPNAEKEVSFTLNIDNDTLNSGLVFHAQLDKDNYSVADTGQEVIYNDATFTTENGIPCYWFGGTNIKFNNNGMPTGGSPRTLSAWVKAQTWDMAQIFGYGNPSSYQMCYIAHSDGIGGCFHSFDAWNSYFDREVWYHVVLVVKDSSNVSVYLNGTLSQTYTGTVNTVDTNYISCGGRGDGTEYFTGYLAGCRIYNRVLTDDEILQLSQEFTPTA